MAYWKWAHRRGSKPTPLPKEEGKKGRVKRKEEGEVGF